MKKLLFIIFLILVSLSFFSSGVEKAKINKETAKVLTFWGIYDIPDVYDPIIKDFEALHPEISIQYKQFPNGEEYHQLLRRQLEKRRGPDIFLFSATEKPLYWKYLIPTGAGAAEGFSSLTQAHLVEDNLLYGLPLWVDSLVLYYNKRYYPGGIPKSWHDFAKRTQEINISGVAMGRLDNLLSGWDILRALMLQKQIVLDGKPSDSLYDTLEFYTRFAYPIDRYFNWSDKLTTGHTDLERDLFARGRVAAVAGFSAVQDELLYKIQQLQERGLRSMRQADVAIATFPQFNPDEPHYLARYQALGVSLYSRNPNMAWEFVEFLVSEKNALHFQQATGRMPGRQLKASEQASELVQIQQEQLPFAQSYALSSEAKSEIEKVVKRGLKDKSLLREILEVSF